MVLCLLPHPQPLQGGGRIGAGARSGPRGGTGGRSGGPGSECLERASRGSKREAGVGCRVRAPAGQGFRRPRAQGAVGREASRRHLNPVFGAGDAGGAQA